MLIVTALQEYLNAQNTKPSTKGAYQSFINKHIAPYFGITECGELSADKIEGFAGHLSDGGLSASKVKAVVGFMKKGLEGRYERDIFSLDIKTRRTKGIVALNLQEQKILEAKARLSEPSTKVGVFLCLYTGIKTGELCGLMWQDVCFDTKNINVNRTVQRVRNEGGDPSAKTKVLLADLTGRSRRSIPIADFLADMLREHRNTCPGEYVISNSAHPAEPRHVQYRFKSLLREAGLAPTSFNELRHTFAVRALESDFCISTLSEILGHASPLVTLGRYADNLGTKDLKRFYMVRFADRLSGF